MKVWTPMTRKLNFLAQNTYGKNCSDFFFVLDKINLFEKKNTSGE